MSSQPESAQSKKGSVSEGGVTHMAAGAESVSTSPESDGVEVDVQGAADGRAKSATTGGSWRHATKRERGGGRGGWEEEEEEEESYQQTKRSKKTRGRVKIDIDFIQDRARRRSTFSKRKKYIMKKAEELATLTGTELLVLATSETRRVHSWATDMFKPMIESQDGLALIEACLGSGHQLPNAVPAAPSRSHATATGRPAAREQDHEAFRSFEMECGEDAGPAGGGTPTAMPVDATSAPAPAPAPVICRSPPPVVTRLRLPGQHTLGSLFVRDITRRVALINNDDDSYL